MTQGSFHGLFVGLDIYQHPRQPELKFATNDAIVLHALFEDNRSGISNLVLDEAATKEKILKEIRRIAADSTGDDEVVIAFSGHGTTTGHLATYDADPDNLHETALSLAAFVKEVNRITARLAIIILDCCFVGGHLAKVLQAPEGNASCRGGAEPVDHIVNGIRSEGRLVIAASGEGQEAFEGRGTNHGLLTHYLIQGLTGTWSVLNERGRISLLRLTEHVMKKVASHERIPRGKRQHPYQHSTMNNADMSVLIKGAKYNEAVADKQLRSVAAGLRNLAKFDFPEPILDGWEKRMNEPNLNQLQLDAINREALLTGKNLLVGAPTSAGKTLIGEIAAMRAIVGRGKAVFLLPSRALVNEQYERLAPVYRTERLTIVRATGELHDQVPELVAGDFHVAFCTYEKFISLLRTNPWLLTQNDTLIVDEIQTLADPDRGPRLEMLLTWVRMRRRKRAAPQIVGLSAALGGCVELAAWLGAGFLESHDRPVPLVEGVVGPDGEYRYRDENGQEREATLPALHDLDETGEMLRVLVGELVAQGEQVIVFRSTRRAAETLAADLADSLGLASAEEVLDSVPKGDKGRLDEKLRRCLRGGVAFHTRQVGRAERRALEKSFRGQPPPGEPVPGSRTDGIRVLVATRTLADGVNLPADSVVIGELKYPSGKRYSVSDYKGMAGRAGRAGMRPRGRSFIIAETRIDAAQKWADYVQAETVPLRSALLDRSGDLRDTVFSVFAGPGAGTGDSQDIDLWGFLEWTFASYQMVDDGESRPFPRENVESALEWLCNVRLLRRTERGFALTELGDIAARYGLHVDSVTTLAEVLSEVPSNEMKRATLIGAAQLTKELTCESFGGGSSDRLKLQMRLRDFSVAKPVLARMQADSGDLFPERARKAIACMMWSKGMKVARIEQMVDFDKIPMSKSFGPVEEIAASTASIMNAVLEVSLCVNPDADIARLSEVLPAQLVLGIDEGLLPIARFVERKVGRAVYLNLARDGFDTVEAILAADKEQILACLGGGQEALDIVLQAALLAKAAEENGDDFGGFDFLGID